MKTVIVYHSKHHGNTKKLLDAIRKSFPDVKLVDITESKIEDLKAYDRIGIASGIYYSKFHKDMLEYIEEKLPERKQVFAIFTCGNMTKIYTKAIKSLTEKKNCNYLGEYGCLGYDTFGPFKAVGGIQKGHPTEEEIEGAVEFYKNLQ